ncbi:MAG TPA: pantoate--beta-alanine ligase [Bacteroidota bacterium]|nr:pantoate--beta-alanine ligase [Bacteroidota bacterium]
MNVIREPHLMQRESEALRAAGKRIALVPTMGALHAGHRALIREACARAGAVVVSVFVNPTQFGPAEDLARYPRDLAKDAAYAAAAGATLVFAPAPEAMYPPGYQTYVTVERAALPLEGAVRPGHFRGVATVVAKLLNITRPHVALFGQKDAQQAVVLRRMVADLDYGVEFVVVPTVREEDGLALSSRNAYLGPAERAEAPVLYRALRHAEELVRRGERSGPALAAAVAGEIARGSSAAVEYVAVTDAATLEPRATLAPGDAVLVSLAARFGATRLIDNILLTI